MDGWHWLLLAALAFALLALLRLDRRSRRRQDRVDELTRRVKRLRRLVVIDRLEHLERALEDFEALALARDEGAPGWTGAEPTVTSYVAACRAFVQRSAEDEHGEAQADEVVRRVLRRFLREHPSQSHRLEQALSPDERKRWLRDGPPGWSESPFPR